MTNKDKILQISKELGLSHIGSNLSCLPILEEIYAKKKPEDKVILDNAHAHLAHLVAREDYWDREYKKGNILTRSEWSAKQLIEKYGIHCDKWAGCDASGGSLAHTGIGLGYAIANPNIKVYTIISDGSACEGSTYEALRIAKLMNIKNWEIHANFNGYTAVSKIDIDYWEQMIKGFGFPVIFHRTNNGLAELDGVSGHYDKL